MCNIGVSSGAITKYYKKLNKPIRQANDEAKLLIDETAQQSPIFSTRGLVFASGYAGNCTSNLPVDLYPFSVHGGRRIDERKHVLRPYIIPPSDTQRFSVALRQMLVDWMMMQHTILDKSEDTELLHLALRYVDTFLAVRGSEGFMSNDSGAVDLYRSALVPPVAESSVINIRINSLAMPLCNKLKRLGMTCLFVAAKITSVNQTESSPALFAKSAEVDSFTQNRLFLAEKELLSTLEYCMYPPTPSSFIGAYMSVTVPCLPSTFVSMRVQAFAVPADELKAIVNYLLDVSVLAHRSLEFSPSLLAAAVIWYTLNSVYRVTWDQLWPLHSMTGYSRADLSPCYLFLSQLVADAHNVCLPNGQAWVNSKYMHATDSLLWSVLVEP